VSCRPLRVGTSQLFELSTARLVTVDGKSCYNQAVRCLHLFISLAGNVYQLIKHPMTQPKIAAGVAFDQAVLEYLRLLCGEVQRDRSFVINAIIREHARQSQQMQKLQGNPELVIQL
jgi:hypothetical protein